MIELAIDIHNKFEQYRDPVIENLGKLTPFFYENIGLIPDMLTEALQHDTMPLADAMHAAYQFGGAPMTGGTVHDDGRYTYPEDPDLFPLATLACARGIVHIYQYGIVAICETGAEPVVYRFD